MYVDISLQWTGLSHLEKNPNRILQILEPAAWWAELSN